MYEEMRIALLLIHSMPSNVCLIAIDADADDDDDDDEEDAKEVVSNTNAESQPKFSCKCN